MSKVTAREVQTFYTDSLQQLDSVHEGDRQAKEALLVGLVGRMNVVLVGESAGGKTTLAEGAYRLVEGIHEENVARIPPQHDLPAIQLVGGEIKTTRTTDQDGDTVTEQLTTYVPGIVKPDTMQIWIDELARGNQVTLQSLLTAFETGQLVTTAGTVELDQLRSVVATMNPVRRGQHQQPISFAMASRMELGARVGGYQLARQARAERLGRIVFDSHLKARDIQPVISISRLNAMERAALQTPVLPDAEKRIIDVALNVYDVIHDNSILEDDARIGLQVANIAKILAFLRAPQQIIGDSEIDDAGVYVATSRLGMLRDLTNDEYQAAMQTVVAS